MNAIVITSINHPTDAVKAFARVDGSHLIVVGDRKTPADWSCPGATFIDVAAQLASPYRLAGALPFNHYTRKMVGYLRAIEAGASTIADTDDDNIPRADFGFPAFDGEFGRTAPALGFVNVYASFTNQRIWPRGLPLDLVKADSGPMDERRGDCRVGVWQGLADGDPDVDAVYRLTDDTPCVFLERDPVVLARGTLSPFNSQNTAFRRELFPLLYLPATVTFRFTDILRGLVAQPVMWAAGYELGFTKATVEQVRNPHDYFADFLSEIPMYQHTRETVRIAEEAVHSEAGVSANLRAVYAALASAGIVKAEELGILDAWLEDLQRAGVAT